MLVIWRAPGRPVLAGAVGHQFGRRSSRVPASEAKETDQGDLATARNREHVFRRRARSWEWASEWANSTCSKTLGHSPRWIWHPSPLRISWAFAAQARLVVQATQHLHLPLPTGFSLA